MVEKLLFTAEEAATLLNVSRTTIYFLVKSGALGHIRGEGVKGPTNIYVPKEELDKYIHSRMKYGHAVTLPEGRKEQAAENLKKAREAKSRKGRGKKIAPLEVVEGTIYALGLKSRTFNLLHAAGYMTIPQVNIHDPEVAKKLACLRGFGISCWNDLEAALARSLAERAGIA